MPSYSKRIKDKVKSDYNFIAKDFSKTRQASWPEFEEFLPYYQAGSVLDLGCGNGRLLDFLPSFSSYLGVDQSRELLSLARKQYPNTSFLLKDMSQIETSDLGGLGAVDYVFSIASFHHIPPLEQLETLKKWKKLMKPGAYLFMMNWNLYQRRFWKQRLSAFFWPRYGSKGLLIPWQKKLKRYYYAFKPTELTILFRKAGFELVDQNLGRNIVSILRTPLDHD